MDSWIHGFMDSWCGSEVVRLQVVRSGNPLRLVLDLECLRIRSELIVKPSQRMIHAQMKMIPDTQLQYSSSTAGDGESLGTAV